MSERVRPVAKKPRVRNPEAPERPQPPTADERSLEARLGEAADWIEGARDAFDELVFTATEACETHPTITRKSLRRSAYEDAIQGMRCLRFALELVDGARGRVRPTGAVK